MPRKRRNDLHEQIEAQIRLAGSIRELEQLAGIGRSHDERSAFWESYCKLRGAAALDEGVAELKRRIRGRRDAPATAGMSGRRRRA